MPPATSKKKDRVSFSFHRNCNVVPTLLLPDWEHKGQKVRKPHALNKPICQHRVVFSKPTFSGCVPHTSVTSNLKKKKKPHVDLVNHITQLLFSHTGSQLGFLFYHKLNSDHCVVFRNVSTISTQSNIKTSSYNPIYSHNSPALPKHIHRGMASSNGLLPHTAMTTQAQHGQLGSFSDQQTANKTTCECFFSLCALWWTLGCCMPHSQEGKLWSEL